MSNSVKESMKVNIEHVCDALLDLGASAEMALSSGSREQEPLTTQDVRCLQWILDVIVEADRRLSLISDRWN